MIFEDVHDALEDIGSNNSRNSKLEKLYHYSDRIGDRMRRVFWYALNPYLNFNIRELVKTQPYPGVTAENIFGYLDYMAASRGASNTDKDNLSAMASSDPKTFEVVSRIINKDLHCGVSVKTAKKLYNEIPEYLIMKAEHGDWDRFMEMAGDDYENICYSLKLNGARVSFATVFEDGSTLYNSSAGKPYHNFHCFDEGLIRLANNVHKAHNLPYPIEFDGEAVTWDSDFQKAMTQLQRLTDINTSIMRLVLWDVICDKPYRKRYDMLSQLNVTTGLRDDLLYIKKLSKDNVLKLDTVFDHNVRSYDDAENIAKLYIDQKMEGAMFKTSDGPYEMRRSWHWFKLKALYIKGQGIEADLPVVDFKYGRKGTKYENVVGKLIVEYKGKKVGVGSGLTDAQRAEFVVNLPNMIEVHADSETRDGSLYLPIFQRVRDDKSPDDVNIERVRRPRNA